MADDAMLDALDLALPGALFGHRRDRQPGWHPGGRPACIGLRGRRRDTWPDKGLLANMKAMADRPGDQTRTTAQQAGDAAEHPRRGSGSRTPAGPISSPGTSMSVATSSTSWWSIPVHLRHWSLSKCAGAAGRDFGLPEETVDHRKRARVRAAAYGLLERGSLPDGVARAATAAAVRSRRGRT